MSRTLLIRNVSSLIKPSRYLYGGVQLRLIFSLTSFQHDDLSKLIAQSMYFLGQKWWETWKPFQDLIFGFSGVCLKLLWVLSNIIAYFLPFFCSIKWKIADFGLVKLLSENNEGDFYAQTVCGTPTYMAPEVIKCHCLQIMISFSQVWTNYRGYTFGADIWSLGCIIFFRCNRGQHLFHVTTQDLRFGKFSW